MKKYLIVLLSATVLMSSYFFYSSFRKAQEPWTTSDLMNPADLAKIIKDPKAKKPVIYSIGPSGNIKGAISEGAASDKGNLENLKFAVAQLPRETDMVIYCGCCAFEHCPNIRPAFKMLKDMQFSNVKLLNLEHNLKQDWIDKGYPMQ